MALHIVKLAVGHDSLQELWAHQQRLIVDYHGKPAVPCLTRYQPTRATEILATGGSLYRVVNRYIQCCHKILGFETVETPHKGTMCAIMQDATMIRTRAMPKRPFQGWRYLTHEDAPLLLNVYDGLTAQDESLPIVHELQKIGLI